MSRLRTVIKKYLPEKYLFDTIDFFTDNKVDTLYFVIDKIIPLKLNKLFYGGDNNKNDDSIKLEINLRNNLFQARVYKYTDKLDNNFKTINFIKINSVTNDNNEFSEADHCGVLILDTDIKESTIQSINNYKECLQCISLDKMTNTKNNPYKIDDILTQVMIYMSINKGMKKINLTDNSFLQCFNEKIPLIYSRTITKGRPFYTKYGFLPINHNNKDNYDYYKNELQIYNDNKKLFNDKPTLSKNKFIDLLFFKKFDKKNDIKMLNYINDKLIPRLSNNNLVNDFIDKIINDKLEESCELLYGIIMNVYYKCGYNRYKYKHFELNLDDKNVISNIKSRIKLIIK